MTGENLPSSQNRNTFTIVATGDSAKDWIPYGYSIGCNDAWKFGKPTDALLICNRPQQFSKDRLHTIINSKPKDFYTWKNCWQEYFPNWQKVRLHPWYGTLHDFHRDGPSAYSSDSSPIIAITLAYNLGAKEIILWGCDFKTHTLFNNNNPQTKREVKAYLEVFEALREKGVKIYKGSFGTVFDDDLATYCPFPNSSFNKWASENISGIEDHETKIMKQGLFNINNTDK